MPFRVSFDLDDADLQHLAGVVQQAHASVRQRSAQEVVAAARQVLEESQQGQPADFLVHRLERLRLMLDMVGDPDWRLSEEDSQRLLNALACFSRSAAPAGPSMGVLDHAIMIELVGRDLTHDLDAYRDFCKARQRLGARRAAAQSEESRREWLEQRRSALQTRMHQRRQRERQRAASPMRRWISLLGL